MKKVSSIYCIIIGVSMLGIWSVLLATGQVREIISEPYRISAHIFSEFVTAGLLITGGTAMLLKKVWSKTVYYISLGALLYSVLTAGGYYLQDGNYAMTIMFGGLLVATIAFITTSVAGSKYKNSSSTL